MLRTILIDDEIHSLESLCLDLKKYCPGVEIVDSCKGAKAGLEGILKHEPDLVFLDIEMPGMSGFELLQQVGHRDFDVIFTTAFDEYAIQAFKVSALDYLLKPIDHNELRAAVQKVQEKQESSDSHKKLDILLTNLEASNAGFDKLAIPSLKGLDFVNVQDILYCVGDGNYTTIHTMHGEKFVISRTMKETEELLQNHTFFRTHQSYLVNLKGIKQYIRGSGGQLVMQDGSVIQVARARKDALMKMIYRK